VRELISFNIHDSLFVRRLGHGIAKTWSHLREQRFQGALGPGPALKIGVENLKPNMWITRVKRAIGPLVCKFLERGLSFRGMMAVKHYACEALYVWVVFRQSIPGFIATQVERFRV